MRSIRWKSQSKEWKFNSRNQRKVRPRRYPVRKILMKIRIRFPWFMRRWWRSNMRLRNNRLSSMWKGRKCRWWFKSYKLRSINTWLRIVVWEIDTVTRVEAGRVQARNKRMPIVSVTQTQRNTIWTVLPQNKCSSQKLSIWLILPSRWYLGVMISRFSSKTSLNRSWFWRWK